MWPTILVLYCVACLLLGLFLTRGWSQDFADSASAAGLHLFKTRWMVVLFAAILMPYLLCIAFSSFSQHRRRLETLRRVGRSYRPYEFVRVNNLELAPAVREQFEFHSPSLIKLDYQLIGDYRMKPEPVVVYDRVFLSDKGEILAAITALLNSGAMGLISILEDGTAVHTTSARNPHPERTVEPEDQLFITYLPDAPAENVHEHHCQTLQKLSEQKNTQVMRFRKDQFREVMVYDQLIFCRWRHRHGHLDGLPPAPDFRTLRTMSGVLDLTEVRQRL